MKNEREEKVEIIKDNNLTKEEYVNQNPNRPSFRKQNTFDNENRIGYYQTADDIESIYIGNMTYKMHKVDISKLFEEYGKVKYVKLVVEPTTNVSKGIAFVQMSTANQTKKAVEALNGKEVNGRTLKVSIATRKENFTPKGNKAHAKEMRMATGKSITQSTDIDKPELPRSKSPTIDAAPVRRRDKKRRGLDTLFTYQKSNK